MNYFPPFCTSQQVVMCQPLAAFHPHNHHCSRYEECLCILFVVLVEEPHCNVKDLCKSARVSFFCVLVVSLESVRLAIMDHGSWKEQSQNNSNQIKKAQKNKKKTQQSPNTSVTLFRSRLKIILLLAKKRWCPRPIFHTQLVCQLIVKKISHKIVQKERKKEIIKNHQQENFLSSK